MTNPSTYLIAFLLIILSGCSAIEENGPAVYSCFNTDKSSIIELYLFDDFEPNSYSLVAQVFYNDVMVPANYIRTTERTVVSIKKEGQNPPCAISLDSFSDSALQQCFGEKATSSYSLRSASLELNCQFKGYKNAKN